MNIEAILSGIKDENTDISQGTNIHKVLNFVWNKSLIESNPVEPLQKSDGTEEKSWCRKACHSTIWDSASFRSRTQAPVRPMKTPVL